MKIAMMMAMALVAMVSVVGFSLIVGGAVMAISVAVLCCAMAGAIVLIELN